ncbi:MAG: hypothetical protein KAV42_10230 [Candidatus Krumholzibacteria bacterium]|nr:hypothetical protein [Candidatus Krumholzibacteria bacterium]
MRNVTIALLLFSMVLFLFPEKSISGVFEEQYGLRPAAIIITDNDVETYRAVREILKYSDARGLVHMPPGMIFGYFPPGFGVEEFAGLNVDLVLNGSEAVPGRMDRTTRKVVNSLFDQRKFFQDHPDLGKDFGPIESFIPGIPEEIRIKYSGTAGPRTGSPSEILERGIEQNAEFLIGTVLVNLVFPSSIGGTEEWTEGEIDGALQYVNVGLSQYMQVTHWVDLEFLINCPSDFREVPVSFEPIDGSWNTDGIWIRESLVMLEAMGHFSGGTGNYVGDTHLFNNAQREEWGTDWVFTSYMVDASFNGCWLGCRDGDPNTICYVAYTIALGGPFQVVPYPACGFGADIHFSHVFIHEMSHVFWALDEYASAGVSCGARTGYLNVQNGNSYAVMMGQPGPCGAQLDCIMNNYELQEPLPICPWTMGQVGLGDYNNNNIPDVYDIPPIVEMIYMPGVSSDTTFDGTYVLGAIASNAAVENLNPRQDGATRVDYAPWLKRGWRQINENLLEAIVPGDGKWDSSRENLSYFLQEGLEPGDNWIHFIVENCVGLQARGSVEVTYVGMKYYQVDTQAGSDYIDVSWITANQVFGAEFDILRKDVTEGTDFVVIDTVDGNDPSSPGARRNYYIFRDEDVRAMHTYEYQITSRINWNIGGVDSVLADSSGVFTERSLLPVVSGIMSPVAPNPFVFSSHDKVEWTVKLPGEFPDLSSSGGRENVGMAAADDKIMLEVDIYNVNGQRVRKLYALPVYGGRYKDMIWDGRNDQGQKVANGIYFLKVRAGGIENVKKVVVLR